MLNDTQVEQFNRDGFLLVKGLLSKADAAMYRKAGHELIERLAAHSAMDATWGSARESVEGAAKTKLLHCHDVQFYDAVFTQLICSDAFTSAASRVMGTPNVQLHHTKMFIKPPEKGSPFPMHQDQPYFPHDRNTMIAAIMHFDDAPVEKGCVRVVPGSHKLGALEHSSDGGWHLPFSEYPLESAVPCPAEAGDVLFFSYLTIHGSGINVSSEARTTLLVQMRDPEDTPTIKTHISRGQGTMLRGINPVGVPEGPK
jgi:ectoine hydroxylase-related dioxygenase (phytanoyl-CoA dioxygenase family)